MRLDQHDAYAGEPLEGAAGEELFLGSFDVELQNVDRVLADPSEECRYRDALNAVRDAAVRFVRLERPASPTHSRVVDLERRVVRPETGVNDFDVAIGRAVF